MLLYRGLICNWCKNTLFDTSHLQLVYLQVVSFAIGVENHGIGIGFVFLLFSLGGGHPPTPQEKNEKNKANATANAIFKLISFIQGAFYFFNKLFRGGNYLFNYLFFLFRGGLVITGKGYLK